MKEEPTDTQWALLPPPKQRGIRACIPARCTRSGRGGLVNPEHSPPGDPIFLVVSHKVAPKNSGGQADRRRV